MKRVSVLLGLFLSAPCLADASDALNSLKAGDLSKIPSYAGVNPKEVGLGDHSALEGAAANVRSNNQHAKYLSESAENRPYFSQEGLKQDKSDAIIRDPKAYLKSGRHVVEEVSYELKKCRESKPKKNFKCARILSCPMIELRTVTKKVLKHRPWYNGCGNVFYHRYYETTTEEAVKTIDESWADSCEGLRNLAKKGICRKVREHCPGGSETRDVPGRATDGKAISRPITRPCWQYVTEYECSYPSENSCRALSQSKCDQINSKCVKELEGHCVEWEQTYRCPQGREVKTIKGDPYTPYFGEHKDKLNYQPNTAMNESLAKLSALKEIQDDIRSESAANNTAGRIPGIFKGGSRKCTIAFAGFSNCCFKDSGWGHSLGLTGCNGEEKDLAQKRGKDLCVEVGTYCDKKVLGQCIKKKKSFCCFPSKLARIVHTQGRAQLGIGWGDGENPMCRGLTPEELSRVDFSKLDMRELHQDIASRIKTKQIVTRNVSERVSQMIKPLQGQGGVQ